MNCMWVALGWVSSKSRPRELYCGFYFIHFTRTYYSLVLTFPMSQVLRPQKQDPRESMSHFRGEMKHFVLVCSHRLSEQTCQLVVDSLIQGTLLYLVIGSCTVPSEFKLKLDRTWEIQSSFNLVKSLADSRVCKGASRFDFRVVLAEITSRHHWTLEKWAQKRHLICIAGHTEYPCSQWFPMIFSRNQLNHT